MWCNVTDVGAASFAETARLCSMSTLCSQCNRWESERDSVCQLCWLSLSIRQVSRNRDFGREDFAWAVDQLSQVLGTLTSRILIEASPALKREEEPRRHKTRDHSPPSSPKGGSLAKEPSKPRKEGKEKGAPVSLPPAPPQLRSTEERVCIKFPLWKGMLETQEKGASRVNQPRSEWRASS